MRTITALAHPIQGLIKYHGIRDWDRILPFHDSISVCMKSLFTITTVKIEKGLKNDEISIMGRIAKGIERERVIRVLNEIRSLANSEEKVRIAMWNSLSFGKGLGFSSSAFASLGLALAKVFNLKISYESLSEIVRLGSGSATRSLVGGFAMWYANKEGRSYAQQVMGPDEIPLRTIIIPIDLPIKTWQIHKEVLASPLFNARLRYIQDAIEEMLDAIKNKDLHTICKLAEIDTLNLHAITMTGANQTILWEPLTIEIIREVRRMRKDGIPVWFSIDTGPSVFINTSEDNLDRILSHLMKLNIETFIASKPGPGARLL